MRQLVHEGNILGINLVKILGINLVKIVGIDLVKIFISENRTRPDTRQYSRGRLGGALVQKPLEIQNDTGRTDGLTDLHGKV